MVSKNPFTSNLRLLSDFCKNCEAIVGEDQSLHMLRARLEELEMWYAGLRASYEECIDDDDGDVFASVNKKFDHAREIYLSVKSKVMMVDEYSPIEAITASTTSYQNATLNQNLVQTQGLRLSTNSIPYFEGRLWK